MFFHCITPKKPDNVRMIKQFRVKDWSADLPLPPDREVIRSLIDAVDASGGGAGDAPIIVHDM